MMQGTGTRRRGGARLLLALAGALCAAGLAACGGSSDDGGASSAAPATSAAAATSAEAAPETAPATSAAASSDAGSSAAASSEAGSSAAAAGSLPEPAEKVTLKLADNNTSEGPSAAIDAIIAAFEAEHPNIDIQRETQAFNNYIATIKLRAAAPDGYDIVEGNVGPGGILAQLVRAGALAPIDDYASQLGWTTSNPESLFTLSRFDQDGKVEGQGSLYGVPEGQGEVVGVYYNKDLLAQLGLEVPTTFAEFEASLAAAKQAGIAPIAVGGLDKWPWGIVFMAIANVKTQPGELAAWFGGDRAATLNTPGVLEAGADLQRWADAGYFQDGANGASDAKATELMASGEALYAIQGPWAAASFQEGLGDKLGFFPFPGTEAGTAPATGSNGWSWAITERSENKDAAAIFLDYVTRPENRALWIAQGVPPAYPGDTAGVPAGSPLEAIIQTYSDAVEAGSLVPYLDNAYPDDPSHSIYANFQNLAAGKMTPEEFATDTDTGRNSFLDSLK